MEGCGAKGARNMKTLIVYDSKYGNTAELADEMLLALGSEAKACDCEQLELGMLEGVELLIIGCPTQKWTASPPARDAAFVIGESVSPSHLKVATFDTGFVGPFAGSGAAKLADMMAEAGFEVVARPEHFRVEHLHGPLEEGETERAREWALALAA
ncbi:MAG: hypothetical protein C0418_01270 [Coriobacteriaceae bacterium]|nr:hypothetical protein [Coriobacteriaceae bacterium]